MQVYEVIKHQTMHFNVLLNRYVEMLVSIKRITEFLNSPDKDFSFVGILGEESQNTVEITDGNFEWSETEKAARQIEQPTELKLLKNNATKQKNDLFRLRGVNLKIRRGETVFVVGKSNSGKSSFLYSILGETICSSSYSRDKKVVMRSGKVSIVTQSPFTFMGTFTENIYMGRGQVDETELLDQANHVSIKKINGKEDLFGARTAPLSQPLDGKELSLDECLAISCLEDDLKVMPQKLNTPISDTSQTISGGQKTRMSLARAIY